VAGEISDKTEDEVRAYAKVFFKRVDELKGEARRGGARRARLMRRL
jgi:hypothetical protein